MCKECGCPAQGNVRQVKLVLSGVTLLNARSVKKSILGLAGVYHVHVHALGGEAIIDFNPTKASLEEITASLTEKGFQVINSL